MHGYVVPLRIGTLTRTTPRQNSLFIMENTQILVNKRYKKKKRPKTYNTAIVLLGWQLSDCGFCQPPNDKIRNLITGERATKRQCSNLPPCKIA